MDFLVRNDHAHDSITVFFELDSADASGRSAHGTNVVLGEANSHTHSGSDEYVVTACGGSDVDEAIIVVDAKRDKTA